MGKKVMLAAADTFRAAAGDQLREWANRSGVDMIGGSEGADPGSVVFDATAAAKARNDGMADKTATKRTRRFINTLTNRPAQIHLSCYFRNSGKYYGVRNG